MQRVHPGGWMPPQQPSASWRSRIQRGAGASRRGAAGAAAPRVGVQHPVEPLEGAVPGRQRRACAVGRGAPVAQLVEPNGSGRTGRRAADDGQRHDGLPGPAAEVVDVQREPRRQVDQLGRQLGQVVPGPPAEQRQPDPGEHPAALHPAVCRSTNCGAFAMCGASGGSPASRSATYASTVVDRSPGPPWKVAQVPSSRCCERIQRAASLGLAGVADAEELPQQQVLGVHRHVGLELALPPARRRPAARAGASTAGVERGPHVGRRREVTARGRRRSCSSLSSRRTGRARPARRAAAVVEVGVGERVARPSDAAGAAPPRPPSPRPPAALDQLRPPQRTVLVASARPASAQPRGAAPAPAGAAVRRARRRPAATSCARAGRSAPACR